MADALAWSPQQQTAIAKIAAWLRMRYAPFFYLAGYAGTGKTTLAKHIAGLQNRDVRYAAYTGKAAKVMRQAGCINARTIHSTIYVTETNPQDGTIVRHLDPLALYDVGLLIVDEVSMVDEEVARDLLSFNVPILVLGDPFQLPPVKGTGYFTSKEPDAMLTEVHRQASDSEIIRLATEIRHGEYRRRPMASDDLTVCRREDLEQDSVVKADAVIVGRNATRSAFNRRLRDLRGFEGEFPAVGEPVICLRNDAKKGIFNGEIFEVAAHRKMGKGKGIGRKVNLTVRDPDSAERGEIPVSVWEHFFQGRSGDLDWRVKRQMQEFDYAHCITAHKAQGSQYPRVCVFDESAAFRENAAQWAYTAVTRASQHLTMVI